MPFPIETWGCNGGLADGKTPFICGGYGSILEENGTATTTYFRHCYQLTEANLWHKDETAVLNTGREYAGYGSVIMNQNQLVLSAGNGHEGYLTSIELISPNGQTKTLNTKIRIIKK